VSDLLALALIPPFLKFLAAFLLAVEDPHSFIKIVFVAITSINYMNDKSQLKIGGSGWNCTNYLKRYERCDLLFVLTAEINVSLFVLKTSSVLNYVLVLL